MEITDHSTQLIRRWFFIFLGLYAFIWTLIPAVSYQTLPRDLAEELMWGSHWELGYFKHPFLTSWLVKAYQFLMPNADWPFYLLSQLTVIICFYAIWRLANLILTPLEAFLSVVIISLSYYYNAAIFEFNPNVLMLPLWALALLAFYQALQTNFFKYWFLTGLWLGLGLITKYETFVLIASMGVLMLFTPEGRKSLATKGPYFAAFIGLLILFPNLYWIYKNNFEPIRYFLERINKTNSANLADYSSRISVLRFLGSQFIILLPTLLVFIPLLRCPSSHNSLSSFNKKFIYMAGLGPLFLTTFVAFLIGADLHDNWGTPFFSAIGVLLIGLKRPVITIQALRTTLIWFVGMILLMAGIIFFGLVYGPKFSEKLINRAHYPSKSLAAQITQLWHEKYPQKLKYIAGEYDLVNYITTYSKDKPIGYSDWDTHESPWINEADLRKHGGMFVWNSDENHIGQFPPNIKERFPNAILLKEIKLKYMSQYTTQVLTFGVALLAPENEKLPKNCS